MGSNFSDLNLAIGVWPDKKIMILALPGRSSWGFPHNSYRCVIYIRYRLEVLGTLEVIPHQRCYELEVLAHWYTILTSIPAQFAFRQVKGYFEPANIKLEGG